VALAWLLNKPGLTAPIIGASKPHHLNDAIGALELKLGTEDIAALESVYVPQAVFGHS
jgi:aryl-alcohol dehydrogenase-like predicted oxidoreductase